MHGDIRDFLQGVRHFLGSYYLLLGAINGLAAFLLWRKWKQNVPALFWTIFAVYCAGWLAPRAMSGDPKFVPSLSETFFRQPMDAIIGSPLGPVYYSVGITLALIAMYYYRDFFSRPHVGWAMLNISLLLLGLSIADQEFAEIVTKPDNVPIVALVFLLGYFTWLATYKAVENDKRAAQGLPPLEKLDDEKVLVWPDLVYTELICMIVLTVILIAWGLLLRAPLEEAGSLVKTPNPSKAPWYFLGLQEMLVYFDPWYAGVVLPSLVIVGLMAIPYLDYNKKGNGYYTISERPFAYLVFQIGFLDLWVTLIILGTFLRGPNWNVFGPYEFWDAHKVLALNNTDLSQFFWEKGLGQALPKASTGSSTLVSLGYILLRESPGIISVLAYFILLPPLLAVTVFRSFFVKMGFIRYMVMVNLLLLMATLPIKMVLRWAFNLKYLVAIPEYFLNF